MSPLEQFLHRAENLLARVEAILPPAYGREPDWKRATAFRWRRRANGGGNPSFSDISGAAAAINELFDDCRIFDASPAPGYSSKAVSPAPATAQRLSAEDAPDEAGKLTAFPNPFTTATLLTFALPETAKYTLTVYDLKGSVAARVSSSEAQAGVRYRFAVGAGLQEGVYVARLVTASGTQTIRLNLLH